MNRSATVPDMLRHPYLLRPQIIGWRRSGAPIWSVAGGAPDDGDSGDGGDGDTGAGSGAGTGSGADGGQTFTQGDLDRIAAREKAQGKRAAEKSLAEKLGVSLDEAQQIIAAHRQRTEAEKTDAQKARETADAATAAAEQARAEAVTERHTLRVERALVAAGVTLPDDEAKRDQALARAARLVDVEVGAEQADVAAAVAGLKADMPALFVKPTAAGGDPGPGPRGAKPGADRYAAGVERARAATTGGGYKVGPGGRLTLNA